MGICRRAGARRRAGESRRRGRSGAGDRRVDRPRVEASGRRPGAAVRADGHVFPRPDEHDGLRPPDRPGAGRGESRRPDSADREPVLGADRSENVVVRQAPHAAAAGADVALAAPESPGTRGVPAGGPHGRRGPALGASGSEVLAVRRRTLRHFPVGPHGRSGKRRPQRGHVPDAGLFGAVDRNALACAQNRRETLPGLPSARPSDARGGLSGRRSRLRLRRDGSDAGRSGRVSAGRVSARPSGRAGAMPDLRSEGSGRLRLRDRGLCRSGRREGGRGAFRRPYGLLFARRPLSAFPCHGPDPPPRCGLSGYGRRHPAAGGRMDRPRDGADLSRPDPHGPAARSPRPDDARSRYGPQRRRRFDRPPLRGAGRESRPVVVGRGTDDVQQIPARRAGGDRRARFRCAGAAVAADRSRARPRSQRGNPRCAGPCHGDARLRR